MNFFGRLVAVLAVVLAGTGAASGQDFGISEIRAGVLAHSIDENGPNGEALNFSRIEVINFEVLFRSPDIEAFRWIGSPRPSLGANLNLGGHESLVRLGLTWHVPVFETPFFLEGTFGAALHNGAASGAIAPARNLGCSLLFYESVGAGMEMTDTINVILAVEHASHAGLCGSANRGLTNMGVKVGFEF